MPDIRTPGVVHDKLRYKPWIVHGVVPETETRPRLLASGAWYEARVHLNHGLLPLC